MQEDAASRRQSQAGADVMTPRTFQRNGEDVLSNAGKSAVASQASIRSKHESTRSSIAAKMKGASIHSQKASAKASDTRSRHSASVQPNAPQALSQPAQFQLDEEAYQERPMHLVPCRWRRDGWKYVESDPSRHGFFNNANRINSVGMSPSMKNKMMERYATKGNPQQTPTYFKDDQRFLDTTYQNFFKKSQANEQLKVATTLASAQVAKIDSAAGVQWAGGYHHRKTFNKHKDHMMDWTNVMFRN